MHPAGARHASCLQHLSILTSSPVLTSQDYLAGGRLPNFVYPSAVDNFKRQFMHLEAGGTGGALSRQSNRIAQATSLPRERVPDFQSEASKYVKPPHGEDFQGKYGVDSLGSHVRSMTVMDHCGSGPYASYQHNSIIRSNSYRQ